ncbi:hypothetical protein AB0J86_04615 [Micromonospora sp. NPDC049559]|uniref:hypothetical protein n=1 Tax=Micromonospora sp. NPDC049559 TaxID=3155923 RepID=UPI003442377A
MSERSIPSTGPNDGWPELSTATALAATDPQAARRQATRLTGAMPVAAVPSFLDHAAARFLADGRPAEATYLFDLARQIEETHELLLGLDQDFGRAHRSFVEFAPSGVVTPAAVHHRLKRLARHPDRRAAHRQAREMVEAFLDAGRIPYPKVFVELMPLAVAAGIAPADEEESLAERILRAGLFSAAALPTWEAAAPALRRLCERRPELTDLLVASRPADDVYDDAKLTEQLRTVWLELLVAVGAGTSLTRDWFFALGPTTAHALVELADQAGTRLFPPGAPPRPAPEADPAIGTPPPPVPPAADADRRARDEGLVFRRGGTDLDALFESAERDPAAGATLRREFDAFVRALGTYDNVDYPAVLRHVWEHPGARRLLDEQLAGWLVEAGSDDLPGLEFALPRLVPLVEAGFADLEPGRLADFVPTDPVDSLLGALRGGLPEELRFPTVTRKQGTAEVSVVQHEGHLTIGVWGLAIQVHDETSDVVHREALTYPTDALPWYDGNRCYLSRYADGVRQTFRLDGEHGLSLDAGTVSRWPHGAPHATLTFPGAEAPSLVRLSRGEIRLSAPDGRTTARLPFSPFQRVEAGTRPVLPPPGWWPYLRPTDPAGSAALRQLDRDTVARLVDAALRGSGASGAELARSVPELTEPRLRAAVLSLTERAAAALLLVVRLRDRLRLDRPAGLPGLLRSGSGLRHGRAVVDVPSIRTLAGLLADTAATASANRTLHPLGTVELPPHAGKVYLSFGELGSRAVEAAWPWTAEYVRTRLLDRLRAWGDTPWGDGSGRLRRLTFSSRAGRQQPRGDLWRTPNGALVVVDYHPHESYGANAIEYSPDGTFEPFELPGWSLKGPPVPQGWGGADRIAAYDRLLAERGPAPYDVDAVRELAARTGLAVAEVASACFGYPFFVGREAEVERYPQEVLDLFHDPATDRPGKSPMSYRLDRWMRPVLMPDDPADLWTRGLDVDRLVAWWERHGEVISAV